MASQLSALAGDLKSEINSHRQTWTRRYGIYKSLYMDLGAIDSRLRGLLAPGDGREVLKLIEGQQKAYPLIEELEKK